MAFPPTLPPLARALDERGYTDPTAVQTAVLAPETIERDLLVSAQTGSGKTIAFGLAIAPTLMADADTLPRANLPLALIVTPTRELALQVHRELTWLYQHAGARVVSCVGGMDPRQERRQLAAGCHIVVGTPGRLRDHLERHGLNVSALKAVVLDEADEMLDLGFREDLEFILEATPKERRTLLLSATLPKDIVTLARSYQRDALRIETTAGVRGHADIEYRAMRIAAHDTEHAVVNVLRYYESPAALVFCNTREAVRHMNASLLERGFAVVSLSGEFSQSERNHALQALRDGKARVCVATDVAARGIDLPSLNLVIHADLPNDADTLQHRSGRTGRAGRKGVSALLVTPARRRHAERLLGQARIRAEWRALPTAEDIRKLDHDRLLATIVQSVSETDDEAQAEANRTLAKELLAQKSPEEIAAALVRSYRARLPAAEDVKEIADRSERPHDRGPREREPRHHEGRPGRDDQAPSPSFTAPENTSWFRVNVGRAQKADPKWLIPEICRQGAVAKRHLGTIRIFDNETKFEVDQKEAEKFADLVSKVTKPEFRIEPSSPPGNRFGGGGSGAPRKFWKSKDRGDGAKPDKPRWSPKKRAERGAHGKSKFRKPGA